VTDDLEAVDVSVIFLGETDNAIRIEDAGENTVWLPKSQIEIQQDEEPVAGKTILVLLPRWLAEEKGLV
jgi:hypothetical protein